MADGRRNNGGARPGAGRKPKPVENAQHSVLLELFNEEAERAVIQNMIRRAKSSAPEAITAATWLWDRKYGKPKEPIEHGGEVRILVVYDDPDDASG